MNGHKCQKFGSDSERRVASILRQFYGREVIAMAYNSSFDISVDGWRVELKAARPNTTKEPYPVWVFNIHRHGVLNEVTDFYILRLEQVPFTKSAIHLLFRAPIGVTVLQISPRMLMNGLSSHTEEFYKFARGEYGQKVIAA